MKRRPFEIIRMAGIFSITLFAGCDDDSMTTLRTLDADVVLTTQQEVDAFVEDHKNIKTIIIDGNLVVGAPLGTFHSTDIHDISGLSNVAQVTGDLYVRGNPGLQTTLGLQHVQRVGGLFNINKNESLETLRFENLESVDGQFVIHWNPSITSLEGFGKLNHIGSYFNVSLNQSLASMTGLGRLDTLYSLEISDNANLTDISALRDLVWVKTSVLIENSALTTLAGLEKVQYVGGDFLLNKGCLNCGNEQLSEIQLSELGYIGGDCNLANNENAVSIDFPALTRIGGSLVLDGFENISAFDGFQTLEKIANELSIGRNRSLEQLTGFVALDSIGSYLRIYENPALTTLSFPQLTSVKVISISRNDAISTLDNSFNPHIAFTLGVQVEWNQGLVDLCSVKPLIDRAIATEETPLISIWNNGPGSEGQHVNNYPWIQENCN